MKLHSIFLISIVLMISSMLQSQTPAFYSDWQSLKIIQTTNPIFPNTLQQLAVTKGETQVVINVNPDGRLKELLVVGYTMPEFADAAVAAIKAWKYEPARWHGENVGTVMELSFFFEATGTVVTSQNVSDILEAYTLHLTENSRAYHTYMLKELDKVPVPLIAVNPQYSYELASKGVKGRVVVNFFIDETGAVRMPSVSVNDDPQLAALAINAIRQWRFNPPTHHGKPVLVKADQSFNFGS